MQVRVPLIHLLLSVSIGMMAISCAYAQEIETPRPASGRMVSQYQEIIPADVLARVKLLRSQLEPIRQATGREKRQKNVFLVERAAPREVYFQAQTLFDKANRLAFEMTGSWEELDSTAASQGEEIRPRDVWQVCDQALRRILVVQEKLALKVPLEEQEQPEHTKPTDVFNEILQANAELNALLHNQVSSSELFEQATLAINYAANIAKVLDIVPRIPSPPAFEANKKPRDVFYRAIECVELLGEISALSNVQMLSLNVSAQEGGYIGLSNTLDINKIIVSEIRNLNKIYGEEQEFRQFSPGYKMPSEVYQRMGILKKQLDQIKEKANEKI